MATPQTALERTYQEKAESQRLELAPMLAQTMGTLMPQIPTLLPADLPTEQFRAALFLELTGRPELQDCTASSLRESVIKAAMAGLLPGRDCHLLAFRNRRGNTKVATFVPNYFGLILALERTGKVAKAFAHPVYQEDDFAIDYLADIYRHVPAIARGRKPGSLKFFYGCVRMKDGTTHLEIMDESQIDAVKRRAPAHDQGPWVDDYLMMARKTALKRVIKYVRLTPELRQVLDDDDERERQDIPPERHRQNIIDLSGEPVDPTAPPPRPRTPPPQTSASPTATNGPWRDNVQALAVSLPDALTPTTPADLAARVQDTCERALRLVEDADTPASTGEAMLEQLRTMRDDLAGEMGLGLQQ